MDGLNKYYRAVIEESPYEPVDVAQVLRATRAQVLVSYLPVGSEDAQKFYAQAAIDAGVAFVNAIPVSSPRTPCGPRSSPTLAYRSSVTTSRVRWVRRSCTECSHAFSKTVV